MIIFFVSKFNLGGNRMISKSFKKVISMVLVLFMTCQGVVFAKSNDHKGHWAESSIESWIDKGYVKGYKDGDFKPEKNITRAEFISIVNRAFEFTSEAEVTYKDVKESHWAYDEFKKASAAGYIVGFEDGTFRPNANITRQEMAAIISRLLKLQEDKRSEAFLRLDDYAQIPEWSAGVVSSIVANGYVNLRNGNSFAPAMPATRAEVVSALDSGYTNFIKVKYYTAGIYTPGVVDGSVEVNGKDVILENAIINGNLIIGEAVGAGKVTLKGVTVKGDTIIKGGGRESITIEDSQINHLIINKKDGKIRVLAKGTTYVNNIEMKSGGKLESNDLDVSNFGHIIVGDSISSDQPIILAGNFEKLEVKSGQNEIKVQSGTIKDLIITKMAKDVKVNLAKNVKVEKAEINGVTKFEGKGKIGTAIVNTDGVKILTLVESIKKGKGVEKVDTNPKGGSNSSTGGDSSDDDSSDDDSSDENQSKIQNINVLLFNDFHGNVAEDTRETGKNIGMAKMVGYVNAARAKNPNTIVVAGGDNYQGTAISNLTFGKPVSAMMKGMNVVASAVGNHEFDWGVEHLETWAKEGNFEFLVANIFDTKINKPVEWAKPYMIIEQDGVKIAFIGLAHPDTATLTKAENVTGLEFTDPVVAAQEWVSFLQAGKAEEGKPDVIMALTHIDSSQDAETGEITGNAAKLATIDGIDAILSAHSHGTVSGEVNGVPIIQAYRYGRAIGIISIERDSAGKVTGITTKVDMVESIRDDIIPDPETEAIYKKVEEEMSSILGEVVGTAAREFAHNTREQDNVTPLGAWVSDVMREKTGTQIAIQNGGGIRRPLYAGTITMGDLYEIMPFDNALVKIDLKGSDIKKAIDHGILNPNVGDGQFAGLIVEYDKNKEFQNRITKISLEDGTPLEMDKYYSVVTIDFLMTGGDKYDFSGARNIVETYIPVRDILVEKIKAEKIIAPKAVDYIIEISDVVDTISIASFRDLAEGETGIVEGVVTAKPGSWGGGRFYLQDETGGIYVNYYNDTDHAFALNNKIRIEGKKSIHNGEYQISPADAKLLEVYVEIPAAKVVDKLDKSLEGQLVTIEDVEITDMKVDNYGTVEFKAKSGENVSVVRIDNRTGVNGDNFEFKEGDKITVTGVVAEFRGTFQLKPRTDYDFVKDRLVVRYVQASVEAGKVAKGTKVRLTSGTPDAKIYYTVDGTDPTKESTLYTEPIAVDEKVTIKVIGVKEGLINSEVKTYSYDLLTEADNVQIYDIQGAQHISPLEGQLVKSVPGIVTHIQKGGFYFQSEEGDDNLDTSDGIYVGKSNHGVTVGDKLKVDGKVIEAEEPGYDKGKDNKDLRTTQIVAINIEVVSSGNDLPAPMVIGIDRTIPKVVAENHKTYNPLNPEHFDSSKNAIDFFESIEGMYVEIPGQVTVTGPQKYDGVTVISEEWGLENRTPAGGVYLEESTQDGFAPEIVTEVLFVNVPGKTIAKTGDYYPESVKGVVGYNFGNFRIEPVEKGLPRLVDGGVGRREETIIEKEDDKLTIAAYNVENFSPQTDKKKVDKLVHSIANELDTPDILGLVEVMDSYGEAKGPDTSGAASYQLLIDEIFKEVGIQYAYTEVAPEQGMDGGIPGGNIRVGYIYNTERVELKDHSVGGPNEAIEIREDGSINFGTGRIDPTNPAFSNSRKSVVTEFVFKGESVFIIGNHWNSKRGDAAPYGMDQPAEQGSRVQRIKIGNVIGDFIADLQAKNNNKANVVVLGDFNDYPWSPPVKAMADKGKLHNALFNLDRNQQYTYTYNGYAQSLDSILVSQSLAAGMNVDVMNINSGYMEEHGRASDHDPLLVQVTVPNIDPHYVIAPGPTIKFADSTIGNSIQLTVGDAFEYPEVVAKDVHGNELTVERTGDEVDTSTAGVYIVEFKATDKNGKVATLRLTIKVMEDYDIKDMTVAQAIKYNSGNATVRGYIVGSINTNPILTKDGNHASTNLLIADSLEETDGTKMLPVQLPNNDIRKNLNLVQNNNLFGVQVMLTGSLQTYFQQSGMKGTSSYTLVDKEENPDVSRPIPTMKFAELTSGPAIQLTVGDTFKHPIVIATDADDNILEVVPTGNVDTATVGVYKVTYTATDAEGKSAELKLTVTVVTKSEEEDSDEGA